MLYSEGSQRLRISGMASRESVKAKVEICKQVWWMQNMLREEGGVILKDELLGPIGCKCVVYIGIETCSPSPPGIRVKCTVFDCS